MHINYRNLTQNKTSINKYCLKTVKAIVNFKSFYTNPIDSFLLLVFNFKTLPFEYKIILERETKSDLIKVEELVRHYEFLDFINQFNKNEKTPKSHEENTILVFYKRTLKKRNEIIDCLLFKIEERALEKASVSNIFKDSGDFKEVRKQIELFSDFPYRELILREKGLEFGINYEKLDYRRINPLSNKLPFFNFASNSIEEFPSVEIKKLLKKFNPKQYLEYIIDNSKSLPIVKNRSEIFLELKELYVMKKWYGFYALALPQIEGIFSEMVNLVEPKGKKFPSLPNKVKFIRSFYDNSNRSFDYYEFYLPTQRNRFSHLGKDKDIKLKCTLLLMDLVDVLHIVISLNSPVIELSKILNEEINYFEHCGRFANFYSLIKKVENDGQLYLVENVLYEFEQKSLFLKFDFVPFIKKLQFDFNKASEDFEESFKLLSHLYLKEEINFFSLTEREINKRIDEIAKIFSNGAWYIMEEDLKLLIDAGIFIFYLKKRYNYIDEATRVYINEFEKINKSKLTKIHSLNSKLNIKLSTDFVISKDKWEHINGK